MARRGGRGAHRARWFGARCGTALGMSPAPACFALAISLCGTLLSACAMHGASPHVAGDNGGQSSPSPTAHRASNPNARRAGINVEPSYRPWRYEGGPAPQSWWCVSPNCSPDVSPQIRIETDLTVASQLGVNHVRVEFPWRFIEPQRGVFDWSRVDLIVGAANAKGVPLLPVVVYSPAWVGAPASAPTPDDFRAFMTALVGRYHTSIHDWELWNEPDLAKYWSDGVQAYVENILIPGYQGVKAADPDAQVVLGGPSWADADWLGGIYTFGGGDNFDIMSWHAYGGVAAVLASAKTVQDILNAHHQSSKPLWLGEYGLEEYATIDNDQSALLTGVLTAHSSIAQADWYTLRDEDAMECCPPRIAVLGSYGLVKRDGVTLKQGFHMLQQLINAGLPSVVQG